MRFPTVLLLLAACASQDERAKPSGFLEPYVGFVPHPERASAMLYEPEGMDLGRYDRLMIDRVVVWQHPWAEAQEIRPYELLELAAAFHETLVAAVADAYPVVLEPGPDVLRLRAALTDVKARRPGPLRTSAAVAFGALSIEEVTIEAELLDSTSGRRLGAIVDKKSGARGLGLGDAGTAAAAFEAWAATLREALDRFHARD